MRAIFFLLLATILISTQTPAYGQSLALSKDKETIERTIQHFFEWQINLDAESVKRAFHPDAKFVFLSKDNRLTENTTQEMIKAGKDHARRMMKANARWKLTPDVAMTRIVTIDISGDSAFVKTEIEYPLALITNYLILLKVGDDWKIVSGTTTGKQK